MRININAMDINYDAENKMLLVENIEVKPTIRRLKELKEVIYDIEFYNKSDNEMPLYYMYRDIKKEEDTPIFEKNSIRFDITVVPPRLLGNEYVKTAGHYHPLIEDDLTYPEIYQVLEGEAHYLIQKQVGNSISDLNILRVNKGGIILIPPNYGHITINPSNDILIMANLVSRNFTSIYEPIKAKNGGAYFELNGNILHRNENYDSVPFLTKIESNKKISYQRETDIYTQFLENPEKFSFLNHPKKNRKLY
jgi:glucose-6-phosphate isomerase